MVNLYVSIGSNSNVAENGIAQEEGRAAIWMDGDNTLSRCDLPFKTGHIGGIEREAEYIANLASYHQSVIIYYHKACEGMVNDGLRAGVYFGMRIWKMPSTHPTTNPHI